MLCRKPYRNGVLAYGCGQCTPCRINKRREWVARLILESGEHDYSAFITLTYNDENLPKNLCVEKKAGQLFLKRLRNELAKQKRRFRYYFVGEYGEKSQRPHYHAILFGVSPTEGELIKKVWPFGYCHIGTAEQKSMSYASSYVVKKWTKKETPELNGRTPEFCLISKNPGLGANFASRTAKAYLTKPGQAALKSRGWFETQFKHDGRKYPIARYIREKIQKELGLAGPQKQEYLQNLYWKFECKQRGQTVHETEVKTRHKYLIDENYLRRKATRTF